MSLIEKLLTTQTIQGPYLGQNRLPTAQVSQALQQVLPKAAAPAALQSINQQLHLNLQVKALPTQNQQITRPLSNNSLFLQPSQQLSARLSQNTLSQIQQHPVESAIDLHLEELLLLEALKHKVRRQITDQSVPSPFAQLSYLPLERPFGLLKNSKRRLRIQGMSFLRFRFAWEDEEDSQEPGQHQRQSEAQEQESQAERKS